MADLASKLGFASKIPKTVVDEIRERLEDPKADEALKTAAEVLGITKRGSGSKLQQIWQEVVGSPASEHTKPIGIKKNVLTVTTHSSVWKQEIEGLRKVEILTMLQGMNTGEYVQDLRVELV